MKSSGRDMHDWANRQPCRKQAGLIHFPLCLSNTNFAAVDQLIQLSPAIPYRGFISCMTGEWPHDCLDVRYDYLMLVVNCYISQLTLVCTFLPQWILLFFKIPENPIIMTTNLHLKKRNNLVTVYFHECQWMDVLHPFTRCF